MNLNILKFLKDEKNHDLIISKYPEIKADLYSYSVNPNCSCKKKIESFAKDEEKGILEIMTQNDSIPSQKPNMSVNASGNLSQMTTYTLLSNKTKSSKYKDVAGEIINIKKSEYREFIEKIRKENWAFKGMSIVMENNDILNIFFY